MPLECYDIVLSWKKRVQLQTYRNVAGLAWHQCGRIWKMGPPLQWKMQTPPPVTYPQYLDCFSKCSNAWSTTFTNPISFLITLFYIWFACFFLVFSHVQIGELTFAASCIHKYISILDVMDLWSGTLKTKNVTTFNFLTHPLLKLRVSE